MFTPYPPIESHLVQVESEKITLSEFQKRYHLSYCSGLAFESYQEYRKVLNLCPWLLAYTYIGRKLREQGTSLRQSLENGLISNVSIRWVCSEIGYGLFAGKTLKKGEYIGEYTGIVRRVSRFQPKVNAYCVHYPTQLWSMNYYVIDALHFGNETRFINHSGSPNTSVKCLVLDSLLHFGFFSNRTIEKGEEITCNYGSDYWQRRTPKS